jgi:hypothetical protein
MGSDERQPGTETESTMKITNTAEVAVNAILARSEELIRNGADPMQVWQATQRVMVKTFGFSEGEATGMTRLLVAGLVDRLGCDVA